MSALRLLADEGVPRRTLDKDFGDLAYRDRRAMPRGVVLVRIDPQTPREVTALFLRALAEGPVEGHFVVVTPEQIRRRRLG